MLNVLSVLIDQSRAKLDECSAQLGHYLCANKVLDGLLLRGLGIYARIKLLEKRLASVTRNFGYFTTGGGNCSSKQRDSHTTNSSSSVSWATSGILIEPVTSSFSLVVPESKKR